LRKKTEAKGFTLRQRLPVYPEFINTQSPSGESHHDLLTERVRSAADSAGYAGRAA
jgi:hypothetical protein